MKISISIGKSLHTCVIGIGLLLMFSTASAIDFRGGAIDIRGGANGIFATGLPANATSISLHGPGTHIESADLSSIYSEDGFADGEYRYEIKGIAYQAQDISPRSNRENGRAEDARASSIVTRTLKAGAFLIVNGTVQVPDASKLEK